MDPLLINISLPEALTVLIFGMIIGAAAATAYWVLPGVWMAPEKSEPGQEVES